MNNTTIAAIATPNGTGGIGIIKISGPQSLNIAITLFKPISKSNKKNFSFESHKFYYGYIVDYRNNHLIDDVLIVYMKSPASYTKEDVVEIHAHSGKLVLQAIFELVIMNGALIAEPGEFTKRAFLNGRIDLTQAEAVIDIINANSLNALESAASQIKGELKLHILNIKKSLLNLLTIIEASIDFPEAENDFYNIYDFEEILKTQIISCLATLIERHERFSRFKNDFIVTIVGCPNVGKSSLLNRLVVKERAIVSPYAGTTRDFIEEKLNLNNFCVTITDTAGIHDTNNHIEILGINKTFDYIKNSDLLLFILDISKPISKDEISLYNKIKHKEIILTLNKSDLMESSYELILPEDWNVISTKKISALTNFGIDLLIKEIVEYINLKFNSNASCSVTPNLRHKVNLEKCLQSSISSLYNIKNKMPLEIVTIDLNSAIKFLDEILGIYIDNDILNSIFSQFCVGK